MKDGLNTSSEPLKMFEEIYSYLLQQNAELYEVNCSGFADKVKCKVYITYM